MGKQLQQAVSILKNGGVVAYPTDTVYGLGADAFNEDAVSRIYRIKGRPLNQPLSVLISSIDALFDLTDEIPDIARHLAERFWPGGLTMIFRKSTSVPLWVTAGGSTLAVRIPDHPVTLDLIRQLNSPLIGTSANLSGLPSITTAAAVRDQLSDAVDFIVDGVCQGGVESTVVDVTGSVPVVLREGAIPAEVIRDLSQK